MRTKANYFVVLLGTFVTVGVLALPAWAQTTRGTITGTVTDQSGGVAAGVEIAVTEIDTGLTFVTTTNSEGDYVAPSLLPGRYRVEAQQTGFQKTRIEPLQLHVDQRLAVNLMLKLGAVSQQVDVTSQGELLQTASSSLGQEVGTKMVLDLPLNGRDFLQLGLLSPGTTTVPEGSDGDGRGSLSISGGRTEANQFSMDGVFNGASSYNGLNIALSVDAIAEFKIQRNTFSAEFGYGTGQVNVASKSGNNNIHGSVYEFIRNDVLDARQFFDAKIPPFRQNQFGASVGGPIRKDKTFFFVNYEGFRWRRHTTSVGTLPSAQELSGDFSAFPPILDPLTGTPFPNNQIPQARFSALSRRILAFLPLLATDAPNNYSASPGSTQDSDQMTIRLDHRLSVKDSLFGRITFYKTLDSYSAGLIPSTGITNKNTPLNTTVQWMRIFSPTLINDLRFGFNRESISAVQDGGNGPDILQFQNSITDPVNNGLPFISISGYSSFGTDPSAPRIFGSNVYSYSDNLTWVHGRHILKFGGGFRNFQRPAEGALFTRGFFIFQGFATGNAVADFLLGNPFVTLGGGKLPKFYEDLHYYDGFVQDDWKVASRLTFNFGMRYERVGALTDRYRGRLAVFDEATGQLVGPGAAVDRAGLVHPDNMGFQPRFGFSWQPFSRPHTVVRGGFGIYNSVKVIGDRQFGSGSEQAWQQIVDINPLIGLPPSVNWDNLFPATSDLANAGILSDDPFSRDPYLEMWSLGIQRELPFDAMLEVTYVGHSGHKEDTRLDINQARLPAFPGEPLDVRRPYPTLGSILMVKDVSNSNYNALQVRLEKRYSHNLSILAAYTYSKSLDTASSSCDLTSCNSPQNVHDLRAEYGPSSFDQRQRLVISPIYVFPFGSDQKYLSNLPRVVNAIARGWQINGIVTFAAGTPFSVQTGGDRALVGTFGGGKQFANCVGQGMLPNSQRTVERDFNTSAFELAPLGTFGNCSRNLLTSRGTNNWDLSLLKNTSLTEKTALQFRAEVFNAWNHPHFGIPVNDPTDAAFGQITSVGSAREIQFALKFLF